MKRKMGLKSIAVILILSLVMSGCGGVQISFGPQTTANQSENKGTEKQRSEVSESSGSGQTQTYEEREMVTEESSPAVEDDEKTEAPDIEEIQKESGDKKKGLISALAEKRDILSEAKTVDLSLQKRNIIDYSKLIKKPSLIISQKVNVPSGIKGGDIKRFTDAGEGEVLPVTVEDAKFPMINRLGCGYDMFYEYACDNGVREAVLNLPQLLADGRVEAMKINRFSDRKIIEESARKYSQEITHKAGIEGGYMCFSGRVDMAFSKGQTNEVSNYFATMETIMQKYKAYIRGATDHKKYLIPEVRKNLNDPGRSPDWIFKTYGHYVLLKSIVGGKIGYSFVNSSSSSSNFENFKLDVTAKYDSLIAKVKANYGYESKTTSESFEATCSINTIVDGGEGVAQAAAGNPEDVDRWLKSLDHSGNLVDFPENEISLIPIWDFVDDPVRRDQLFNAFVAKSNEFRESVPEADHRGKRYITRINLGVHDKDHDARKEAAMDGMKVLEPELNFNSGGEYIYLGVMYGEPGDWGPSLTDIFVSTKYEGGEADFNHLQDPGRYVLVLKNETAHGGKYKHKWYNLNYNAGGSEMYMYASYELGKTRAPIYDLEVYDAGGEKQTDLKHAIENVKNYANQNHWEIVPYVFVTEPAELNKEAGGNYLFLLMRRDFTVVRPQE